MKKKLKINPGGGNALTSHCLKHKNKENKRNVQYVCENTRRSEIELVKSKG